MEKIQVYTPKSKRPVQAKKHSTELEDMRDAMVDFFKDEKAAVNVTNMHVARALCSLLEKTFGLDRTQIVGAHGAHALTYDVKKGMVKFDLQANFNQRGVVLYTPLEFYKTIGLK